MTYPINQIRSDFPILQRYINQYPLVYLDNAASAQKPNLVIDSEMLFYRKYYAAVHRGIHTLSNEATNNLEKVRNLVAKFINAVSSHEIIFVKGATEGINLVAYSWAKNNLKSNDKILISVMEHHANIIPWQILAQEKKIQIIYIPLLSTGELDLHYMKTILNNTKISLVAITHVSNVLGIINPIKKIISIIRKTSKAIILIDGAQSVMHQKVDVQELDCDFYVFSGHKLYGPSGIGILYGKYQLLKDMPPWEGGGSMINSVSLTNKTTFNEPPWRFEAGSLNTAGIIGLGAAINYVQQIGLNNIKDYEKKLMDYTIIALYSIPELILYSSFKKIKNRTGVISFNLGKHHAYDVGSFLDQYGIAIRTGHQCAMPLMKHFKVNSMCRISLAIYNNQEDIDKLISSLIKIKKLLG